MNNHLLSRQSRGHTCIALCRRYSTGTGTIDKLNGSAKNGALTFTRIAVVRVNRRISTRTVKATRIGAKRIMLAIE